MLGMSAAVLKGLNEMRNPTPPTIKEVTEEEMVSILKLQGTDALETQIALSMLKAGAAVGANNNVRLVLKKN